MKLHAAKPAQEETVYFGVPEIAAILGWTYQKAFGWMRREEVLIKKAGRWCTTPNLLRAKFPEVWAKILVEREERAAEGEDDEPI